MSIRLRAIGLVVLGLVGVLSSWSRFAPVLVRWLAGIPADRPDLEGALATTLATTLLLSATWLCLMTVVAALETVCTGATAVRRWGAPRGVRILVALLCGAATTSVLAWPASAENGSPGSVLASPVDGLPLPDRVLDVRHPQAGGTHVVVRPGDSLSLIAARLLPTGRLSTAAVDTAWRALYAANRRAVGPDPDLVRPGLRLTVPRSLLTERTRP